MNSDTNNTETTNLTSILERFENIWSSQLGNVSIAAEFPISAEDAEKVQRVYRIYCGLYENRSDDRRKFLRRYPAVHVLFTTYIASEKYINGGLWPQLADALEVSNTQTFHNDWGESFTANLRTLGLHVFSIKNDDIGWALLGNIMIHCGIPTACLDDYYVLITKQRDTNPHVTAAEFVTLGHQKANIGQLYIDKPIVRLLKFGGNFAVDLTDRIFELLDAVAAGSDGSEIPLPKRFSVSAEQLYSSGKLSSSHEHNKSLRPTSRPLLTLYTSSNIPALNLPSVDATDGEITWIVELDDNPQEITAHALWPGSTALEQKIVPIQRPIRLISVSIKSKIHSTTNLTIVDEHDPFIAFDEAGLQISTNLLVPRPTWLLVPGESSELVFDGEASFLAESVLPTGWSKWSLTLVDLTNVHSVRHGMTGKEHEIHTQKTAHINNNAQIEHVKSLNGSAVFSNIPMIEIPEELSAANWEVSLINDMGKVINRVAYSGSYVDDDLWSPVSKPILGEYTIRVRGPWGRGASKTIFIAEGLTVNIQPKWRNISAQGLAKATVSVNAVNNMRVKEDVIELLEDNKEGQLKLFTDDGQHSILLVRPPATSISYQSTHTAIYESIQRQILYTEDVLEDAGSLIIHIGNRDDLVIKVLHNDNLVQTIVPIIGAQDTYKFDLSKITDTLRHYKQLTLSIDNGGIDLIVAVVQPKKLFSEVSIDGQKLLFNDCVDISGLVALVYLQRAPWLQPTVLDIENGIATLPERLTNAGPLSVIAKIQDPWVSEVNPTWPSSDSSYTCTGYGYYSSEDEEETALSCFLSYYGEKELPERIKNFTRIWAVLANIDDLGLIDFKESVEDTLRAKIAEQARDALLAVEKSTLSTSGIPSAIISSGLVWANLSEGHDDNPTIWTTRGTIPATLLSGADHAWSDEEINAAIEILGDNTAAIINLKDPNPMAGTFDEGSDKFVSNITLRSIYISQMGLIPKGLLDEDTRIIAAMDLIEQRDNAQLRDFLSESIGMVNSIQKILLDNVSPEINYAFTCRMHPISNTGWRAIPSISIGLAILSRYASRGYQFAVGALGAYEAHWVSLATVAPKFVTIDIVLAELLVAGAMKKDETYE